MIHSKSLERYLNLDLDIAYFHVEQKNPLNSDKRNNWKMANTVGVNYAKGVELGLKWKSKNTKLGIGFDYTYTDSYDSNNCYDGCTLDTGMKDAKVRVPRNTFTSTISHETLPGLKNSLLIKYVDETRDFGNANNSWTDVLLDDYITFGLSSDYRISENFDITFNAMNGEIPFDLALTQRIKLLQASIHHIDKVIELISNNMEVIPALLKCPAICAPIVPAPSTATF